MFLFFSYFLSLEEDFVRWREAFWPAVLSKYNIDVREIKRYISTRTNLFVMSVILYFFLFFEIFFWLTLFSVRVMRCALGSSCTSLPKMTLGVTF